MEYILCIDSGTTNIKIALINKSGEICRKESLPMTYLSGHGSLFNPEDLFQQVCHGISNLIQKDPSCKSSIKGLSFTGQRATVVPVDKMGKFTGSGVTWQDTNCEQASQAFYQSFLPGEFEEITGLPQSTLWTVSKIASFQQGHYDWSEKTEKFLILCDYLLFRFGSEQFFTDQSNASVTGLYDTKNKQWSSTILSKLNLTPSQLPKIGEAGARVGEVSNAVSALCDLPPGIPLLLGAGDQQCAALGGGAYRNGDAVLCLGTAAILNCIVSSAQYLPESGSFCTAHCIPGRWVLESIQNAYGTSLSWGSSILSMNDKWDLIEQAHYSPQGSNGVLFLPYLAGIGSPDFDASSRGAFIGLDINHSRQDMARAIVEGVSFEVRRILDSLESDHKEILISGGSSESDLKSRILAEICGRKMLKLQTGEASLLGLSILGWHGLGEFNSLEEAINKLAAPVIKTIVPSQPEDYNKGYKQYLRAVKLTRQFTSLNHGKQD